MPKRRNKAAKIRAVLADNPDATAKAVVEALAAQRVCSKRMDREAAYTIQGRNVPVGRLLGRMRLDFPQHD